MAKKIKFPLTMDDDVQVRDLDELREHFDLDKVLEYYLDGKLLTWLEARYYDAEANEVRALDKNDGGLRKKLCGIFDVEYDGADAVTTDIAEMEERNRKLSVLRQYTSDPAILEKVDSVAFNQEDLADLLDNDVHDIYLCNNSFSIPLRVEDKKYIGIGKAEAVIKSEELVDFVAKKIVFENVEFDAKYAEYAKTSTAEEIASLLAKGKEAEMARDDATAFSYYMQAAEAGDAHGMYCVGWAYVWGRGVPQDTEKAEEWLGRAVNNGSIAAMILQGDCYIYHLGGFEYESELWKKSYPFYKKAAELGSGEGMYKLAYWYFYHWNNDQSKLDETLKWGFRAIENGYANARVYDLFGFVYRYKGNLSEALRWAKKAVDDPEKEKFYDSSYLEKRVYDIEHEIKYGY